MGFFPNQQPQAQAFFPSAATTKSIFPAPFGVQPTTGFGMGQPGSMDESMANYVSSPIGQAQGAAQAKLFETAGVPPPTDLTSFLTDAPEAAGSQGEANNAALAKIATVNPDLAKQMVAQMKGGEDKGFFGNLKDAVGNLAAPALSIGGKALELFTRPLGVVYQLMDTHDKGDSWYEDIGQGLSGKNQLHGDHFIRQWFGKDTPGWVQGAAGLGLDIVADPLTWATFGYGAVGRRLAGEGVLKAGVADTLGKTGIDFGGNSGLVEKAKEVADFLTQYKKADGNAALAMVSERFGKSGVDSALMDEIVAKTDPLVRAHNLLGISKSLAKNQAGDLTDRLAVRKIMEEQALNFKTAGYAKEGEAMQRALGGLRFRAVAKIPFTEQRWSVLSHAVPGTYNLGFGVPRNFFRGMTGLNRVMTQAQRLEDPEIAAKLAHFWMEGGYKRVVDEFPQLKGRLGTGFGSINRTASEMAGTLTRKYSSHSSLFRNGGIMEMYVASAKDTANNTRKEIMKHGWEYAAGSEDEALFVHGSPGITWNGKQTKKFLQKTLSQKSEDRWDVYSEFLHQVPLTGDHAVRNIKDLGEFRDLREAAIKAMPEGEMRDAYMEAHTAGMDAMDSLFRSSDMLTDDELKGLTVIQSMQAKARDWMDMEGVHIEDRSLRLDAEDKLSPFDKARFQLGTSKDVRDLKFYAETNADQGINYDEVRHVGDDHLGSGIHANTVRKKGQAEVAIRTQKPLVIGGKSNQAHIYEQLATQAEIDWLQAVERGAIKPESLGPGGMSEAHDQWISNGITEKLRKEGYDSIIFKTGSPEAAAADALTHQFGDNAEKFAKLAEDAKNAPEVDKGYHAISLAPEMGQGRKSAVAGWNIKPVYSHVKPVNPFEGFMPRILNKKGRVLVGEGSDVYNLLDHVMLSDLKHGKARADMFNKLSFRQAKDKLEQLYGDAGKDVLVSDPIEAHAIYMTRLADQAAGHHMAQAGNYLKHAPGPASMIGRVLDRNMFVWKAGTMDYAHMIGYESKYQAELKKWEEFTKKEHTTLQERAEMWAAHNDRLEQILMRSNADGRSRAEVAMRKSHAATADEQIRVGAEAQLARQQHKILKARLAAYEDKILPPITINSLPRMRVDELQVIRGVQRDVIEAHAQDRVKELTNSIARDGYDQNNPMVIRVSRNKDGSISRKLEDGNHRLTALEDLHPQHRRLNTTDRDVAARVDTLQRTGNMTREQAITAVNRDELRTLHGIGRAEAKKLDAIPVQLIMDEGITTREFDMVNNIHGKPAWDMTEDEFNQAFPDVLWKEGDTARPATSDAAAYRHWQDHGGPPMSAYEAKIRNENFFASMQDYKEKMATSVPAIDHLPNAAQEIPEYLKEARMYFEDIPDRGIRGWSWKEAPEYDADILGRGTKGGWAGTGLPDDTLIIDNKKWGRNPAFDEYIVAHELGHKARWLNGYKRGTMEEEEAFASVFGQDLLGRHWQEFPDEEVFYDPTAVQYGHEIDFQGRSTPRFFPVTGEIDQAVQWALKREPTPMPKELTFDDILKGITKDQDSVDIAYGPRRRPFLRPSPGHNIVGKHYADINWPIGIHIQRDHGRLLIQADADIEEIAKHFGKDHIPVRFHLDGVHSSEIPKELLGDAAGSQRATTARELDKLAGLRDATANAEARVKQLTLDQRDLKLGRKLGGSGSSVAEHLEGIKSRLLSGPLSKAEKGEGYLYHGTQAGALDGIIKDGLKSTGKNWATEDHATARAYAALKQNAEGEQEAILRFKKSATVAKKTHAGRETVDNINPNAIEVQTDHGWEPLVKKADRKAAMSQERQNLIDKVAAEKIKKMNDAMGVRVGKKDAYIRSLRSRKEASFREIDKMETRYKTDMAKVIPSISGRQRSLIADSGLYYDDMSDIPGMKGLAMHKYMAQELRSSLGNKPIGEIRQAWRQFIQNHWKRYSTVYYPGFHARNFMGAWFNNWLGGVNFTHYEHNLRLTNILRAEATNTETKFMKGADRYLGKELELRYGVVGLEGKAHGMVEWADMAHHLDRQMIRSASSGIMQDVGLGENALRTAARAHNPIRKWEQAGGAVMETTENFFRGSAWLAGMEHTMGSETGSRAFVMMRHGDYDELTDGENFIKDLVPFYKWNRTNIPFQLHNLLENPAKQLAVAKLQHEAWVGVGKGKEWERDRSAAPSWVQDSLNIPMPFGEQKSHALKYAMLDLPMADLNTGLNDYVGMFLPMVRPLVEAYWLKSRIGPGGSPIPLDQAKPLNDIFNNKVLRSVFSPFTKPDSAGQPTVSGATQAALAAVPIYARFKDWIFADPKSADRRARSFWSAMVGSKGGNLGKEELNNEETAFYFDHIEPTINQFRELGAPLPSIDQVDESVYDELNLKKPVDKAPVDPFAPVNLGGAA